MNARILFSMISLIIFCAVFIAYSNSGSESVHNSPPGAAGNFSSYWYQGKAEINRYRLQQVRYGEIREGEAVLIFVTEDFLADKQVKYEYGEKPADLAKILKLNFVRKFNTGIYPYSMMSSVFTPVNNQPTYKVTSSVQEWCGHTYSQLNLRDNQYHGMLRSYFQAEGDRDYKAERVLLEDELWTKIRLNPESISKGTIKIIPGQQYQRLSHIEPGVQIADVDIKSIQNNKISDQTLQEISIRYLDIPRRLTITYTSDFPYEILAWEEETEQRGKTMTTRAERTHSMLLDYWSKNGLADNHLQDELGLQYGP